MKHSLSPCASLLALPVLALVSCGSSRSVSDRPHAVAEVRALNPISPQGVYIADPEVRQMPDGRVYVYGSRDESPSYWCSRRYNVLSSSDLVTWRLEQTSFATKGEGKQTDYTDAILYAPDCIHHDGKYYLYYCLANGGENEGVAVAESPYGPFRNGQKIAGISGIDPSVFIDDDGQAYLFWGQGSAKGAKLSKDMTRIEGDVTDGLVTYQEHHFNEGSSVRKRNGIYYFVYGGHGRHGHSNCATLEYATSRSPLGPYTYQGVIVDNFGSGRNLENNHGCITCIDGRWYVAYHRPTHATSTMRKACLEPIEFLPDGRIKEVEMTTQGVGGPMRPTLWMEAWRACLLTGHVKPVVRRPENDAPVEYLSEIRHGDSFTYRYYDFDAERPARFRCKTYGAAREGSIEIRLDSIDGPLIGVCPIAPASGETAYAIHDCEVKAPRGLHAVVLVAKSAGGEKEKDLMNLDWFTFEK